MPLSLRYRVPNPPPHFVGREVELSWIARQLERGPLVVVGGPDGVGKSALALQALAHMGVDTRALRIAARPGDPAESVLRHVLWALAELDGRRVDAAARARVPEEAVESALELAEAARAVVLLEDLNHVENTEEVHELVVQLASFARKSRWLITTHQPPNDATLAGRSLVLGGLSEDDLVALGALQEVATPDSNRDRSAARLAAGSPWVFLQLRTRGLASLEETRKDLLEGISKGARQLLSDAIALRHALDGSTLLAVCGASGEALRELASRGLLVETDGGWRAHDAASGLIDSGAMPPLNELARRLSHSDVTLGWVESVRLLLKCGDEAGAREVLDRRGEALLAAGEAARLWSVLATAPHKMLESWRLRCAAELGNHTVLAAARPAGRPVQVLEWAEMLRLMGDPRSALDELRRVKDSPEKRQLEARCAIALGEAERAHEILADSTCPLAELAAAILGLVVPQSTPRDDRDALDAARAAWWRGERERAELLAAQVSKSARGADVSFFLSREARLLEARAAADHGRLDEASRQLEVLRPFVRGPTALRAEWAALDAELRLLAGPFGGLLEDIEEAIGIARDSDAAAHARLSAARGRLLTLLGHTAGDTPDLEPAWRYTLGDVLASLERQLLTRPREVAAEALAMGRAAEQAGLATVMADALCLACDARLAAGEDYHESAQQLLDHATLIGASRLADDARYLLFNADLAVVERTAASYATTPRNARRAQAQLGHPVRLDSVDRAVLEALAAPRIDTLHTTGAHTDWVPGWGIDDRDKTVWFWNRDSVALSHRPLLFAVLAALHDHGGETSKEVLIEVVWEERQYHPTRHDPKLFVAIRALRRLIEVDAGSPTLLLTAPDGYALARPFRRCRG